MKDGSVARLSLQVLRSSSRESCRGKADQISPRQTAAPQTAGGVLTHMVTQALLVVFLWSFLLFLPLLLLQGGLQLLLLPPQGLQQLAAAPRLV